MLLTFSVKNNKNQDKKVKKCGLLSCKDKQKQYAWKNDPIFFLFWSNQPVRKVWSQVPEKKLGHWKVMKFQEIKMHWI